MSQRSLIVIAAVLLCAVSAQAQLPENPVLSRSVALIEDGQPLDPHIPPVRTSLDGRIGLNMKEKRLMLISPELLNQHFLDSPDGASIVANPAGGGLLLDVNSLHASTYGIVDDRHAALCEKNPAPQPCTGRGDDGKDCYDLTVITPMVIFDGPDGNPSTIDFIEMWGVDITVKVSNPKTAGASMDTQIVYGTPVKGADVPALSMFETMVTADGRLLVGRSGGSNANIPGVDVFYVVGDETDSPCDVTQWDASEFHSVSYAYHDPRMIGSDGKPRYGFAAYPLRDPEGNLIPKFYDNTTTETDFNGSYPWIDRTGANLFFTTVHSTFWYRPTNTSTYTTRYPAACVPEFPGCLPADQFTNQDAQAHDEPSNLRGTSMFGSWTRGKIVMLDGIINNNDFGTKIENEFQRMVQLYENGTGPGGDGWVRIGMGRNNGPVSEFPPGYVNNGTFIESTEQLFNALDQMTPRTPRDVVWFVNTGHVSDEVAFDDWVNPNGLINSEMNMSMTWNGTQIPGNNMELYDGFARTGNWTGDGFDGTQEVRVQNSATGHGVWNLPTAGRLRGNARMEPVALGGIRGHGMWLDGSTGIRYDVPQTQPQDPDQSHWYTGLFIDARFANDDVVRDVIRFPDDSRVQLAGRSQILFRGGDGLVKMTYNLPAAKTVPQVGWFHLGLLADPGGQKVRLYRNGDRLTTWNSSDGTSLFRLTSGQARGEIWVGKIENDPTPGFRGWVDEFKVFGELPNREVICNHARGTMVEENLQPIALGQPDMARSDSGLTSDASGPSRSAPTSGHASELQAYPAEPKPATRRYCFHDYSEETGAHLGNIPAGAWSIRERLIFNEGPLEFDEPRPDSSMNAFCLSCHTSDQVVESLQVGALTENLIWTLQVDPRRQPMMPPRMIYGHIPAGYYPSGDPATDLVAPPSGFYQDEWVFPPLP
ncbi:hypothetical protein ABI59_14355 [Acidobacteria bacterium Mor1]|nr:hypothetical protein ABI59_14355 [Acidobacteria bacterium Mor1]